jgi:hypothetical protein
VKVMVQAESSVAGVVVTGVRTQSVTVAVEPSGWAVTSASTLPWGGLLVPAAVSVTVTVQVAGLLAGVVGGQFTVVAVLRVVVVSSFVTNASPELSPRVRSNARGVVGKSLERVCPVTYVADATSTSIPRP